MFWLQHAQLTRKQSSTLPCDNTVLLSTDVSKQASTPNCNLDCRRMGKLQVETGFIRLGGIWFIICPACVSLHGTGQATCHAARCKRTDCWSPWIQATQITNGALRDAMYRLYQGGLYLQNVTLRHGTRVNVISFMPTTKVRPFYFDEGPRSRCYGCTAALRHIEQPSDEDDNFSK